MSAIEIVIARLKATPAVTALVPKASHYPIVWPETALPPVNVLNVVGDSDPQTLAGGSRYYNTRIRIDSLATTGTAAVAIGSAVRDALDVTKATIAGYHDVDIAYLGQSTDWADDRSMARVITDASVRWRA